MDQIILLGDSITEDCYSTAHGPSFLGSGLSDAYARKVDVVNRGLGGYNTRMAMKVMHRVLPDPSSARVVLMTVLFGTNDAALPFNRSTSMRSTRHVPLEEFQENIAALASHPLTVGHEDAKVILVTPPPVDERKMILFYGDVGYERTAEQTAIYAQAVRRVGARLNVPVLDLWTILLEHAGHRGAGYASLPGSQGAPKCENLQDLLHDGMHLGPPAYFIFHQKLMEMIEQHWPSLLPHNLAYAFPHSQDPCWQPQDIQA
jgi:lysophospholipase L1-like esterase